MVMIFMQEARTGFALLWVFGSLLLYTCQKRGAAFSLNLLFLFFPFVLFSLFLSQNMDRCLVSSIQLRAKRI